MDKPKISRKSQYHQGLYHCLNPAKYAGNSNEIIYRSSWEKQLMRYFDLNKKIIQWTSEQIIIPYVSPIDNKTHRYFIDFGCVSQLSDNTIKKFLIEVKPFAQTKAPVLPKGKLTEKQKENYKNQWKTYIVNRAKWTAAQKYCEQHGFVFIILTEKQLFRSRTI